MLFNRRKIEKKYNCKMIILRCLLLNNAVEIILQKDYPLTQKRVYSFLVKKLLIVPNFPKLVFIFNSTVIGSFS